MRDSIYYKYRARGVLIDPAPELMFSSHDKEIKKYYANLMCYSSSFDIEIILEYHFRQPHRDIKPDTLSRASCLGSES